MSLNALSLSEVVTVNLTLASAAVPQPAFGVPLILGTSNRYTPPQVIQYFSSAASMLAAGGGPFLITDPEYLKAVALTSQAVVPTTFAVGSQAVASVAQVNTIAINTVTNGNTYQVTVNGMLATYTAGGGDTADTVALALVTAVNALTGANVQAVHTTSGHFTITSYNTTIQTTSISQGATWPGLAFTCTIGGTGVAQMTNTATTPNTSIVTGLQTIQGVDQGWYCVNLCSTNWYDLLNMAAYIETQTLVFVGYTADAAVGLNTCTHDVVSQLQALSYNRTAVMYTGDAAHMPDSAWTGANVPLPIGQSVWSLCALVGVTPDNWSQTVFNTVAGQPGTTVGKNGNVYVTIAGNNVVLWGQAVSGRFFDITIGLDWLKNQIQGNIWATMIASRNAGGKVPYTNQGLNLFAADVKQAINLGASQGLINTVDFPVTINVGNVVNQTLTQQTNRVAPPISFTCTLQGAFSTCTVSGVLSV